MEPVPLARGNVEPLCEMEAEFGSPQWGFGMSTYAFLSPGRIVCSYTGRGASRLALLDTENGELEPIETPYSSIALRARRRGHGRRGLPGRLAHGTRVHREVGPFYGASTRSCAGRATLEIDAGYLSVPEPVEFPTENGLTAYALLLRPEEPGLRGARGRASAAPRDEPRWSHVCDIDGPGPGDPVLDQPRHRRARRELRREHGLRAGVPAPPRRGVGRRGRRGLRQRGRSIWPGAGSSMAGGS